MCILYQLTLFNVLHILQKSTLQTKYGSKNHNQFKFQFFYGVFQINKYKYTLTMIALPNRSLLPLPVVLEAFGM